MIHVFEVQPFIATLAAMFLARGLCYVISNRVDLDQRSLLRRDGADARSRWSAL